MQASPDGHKDDEQHYCQGNGATGQHYRADEGREKVYGGHAEEGVLVYSLFGSPQGVRAMLEPHVCIIEYKKREITMEQAITIATIAAAIHWVRVWLWDKQAIPYTVDTTQLRFECVSTHGVSSEIIFADSICSNIYTPIGVVTSDRKGSHMDNVVFDDDAKRRLIEVLRKLNIDVTVTEILKKEPPFCQHLIPIEPFRGDVRDLVDLPRILDEASARVRKLN